MSRATIISLVWISMVLRRKSLKNAYHLNPVAGIIIGIVGLISSFPVMSFPILEIPTSFVGEYGADPIVIDPIIHDISDSNDTTTDYFVEWVTSSFDATGKERGGLTQSREETLSSILPLDPSGIFYNAYFPEPGLYSLRIDLVTYHIVDGPICSDRNNFHDCFIENSQFLNSHPGSLSSFDTTASMAVQLVPEPPASLLFSIGLMLLVVMSKFRSGWNRHPLQTARWPGSG
jgi:hypothetical protein